MKHFQKQSSNPTRNQSLSSIERAPQDSDNKDKNESVSASSEDETADSKTNSGSGQNNTENTSCACQRLTIHVLDISKVFVIALCIPIVFGLVLIIKLIIPLTPFDVFHCRL